MFHAHIELAPAKLVVDQQGESISYWLHPADVPATDFECCDVRLYQTDKGWLQGRLLQTKSQLLVIFHPSTSASDTTALVSTWVHAYNNLIATISGYAELLNLEAPHPYLQKILDRTQTIQEFNQKASFISGKHVLPEQSCRLSDLEVKFDKSVLQAEIALDIDTLGYIFTTLEDLNVTVIEQQVGLSAFQFAIGKGEGYLAVRWQFETELPFNDLSVASIYKGLRNKCGYQTQFDLMVLPFLVKAIGGTILIDNLQQGGYIDIWFPVVASSNPAQIKRCATVLIEDDSQWSRQIASWLWQQGVRAWYCSSKNELQRASQKLGDTDEDLLILQQNHQCIQDKDYSKMAQELTSHFS